MKTKLLVATIAIFHINTSNANVESPLEELLNTKVTIVSKAEERAFDAATAIHVITKEDIRNSGATTIPEILRLAPGVQVAKSGSNQWAISVRGFNGQFANRLLVLMDGRSLYSPLYSGIYWDVQDTLIEDIKQIEIIRGPGATLWGANAVNGVINIITEEAVNTQRGYTNLIVGNDEQIASTRYGGKLSENAKYRFYGKFSKRNESKDLNYNNSNDEWNMWRAGFRIDGVPSTDDMFTLQGDIYTGQENHDVVLPTTTSPFTTTVPDDEEVKGGNILVRWNKIFKDGSNITTQSYIDYNARNILYLNQQVLTYDLDLQYNLKKIKRHQFTLGAAYRFVSDDISGSFYLSAPPSQRNNNLYSAFIQDKINVINNKLALTIGSKIEHNEYTGLEHQPSAKIAYTPNIHNTIWASVSRAVKVPDRSSNDGYYLPTGTVAGYATFRGNSGVKSEKLTAYEAGYRTKIKNSLILDLTGFYNFYKNTPSYDFITPINYTVANEIEGKAVGYEISTKWNLNKNIILSANYTHINLDIDNASSTIVTSEVTTPKHQVNLSSHMKLPYNIQFNNFLFYNHKIMNGSIPAYYRWDSNLKWKAKDALHITLAAQNLLDNQHQEFTGFLYKGQANVGRSFYIKMNYHF